jgi:hypothetical protein
VQKQVSRVVASINGHVFHEYTDALAWVLGEDGASQAA